MFNLPKICSLELIKNIQKGPKKKEPSLNRKSLHFPNCNRIWEGEKHAPFIEKGGKKEQRQAS